jgi:hypothetical protein
MAKTQKEKTFIPQKNKTHFSGSGVSHGTTVMQHFGGTILFFICLAMLQPTAALDLPDYTRASGFMKDTAMQFDDNLLNNNIIHVKAAKGDTAAYAAQDDLRSTLTGSGKRKLDHDKCKDCGKKHGGQQCWKKRPHLAPKWFVKMLIDQGELPRNFLDQKNGKFDKSGNANKPGNKSDNKKFKPLPRPNPKASNCALCNSAQHTTAKCSGNAFRKGFKYCTECNSAGHKATNCL